MSQVVRRSIAALLVLMICLPVTALTQPSTTAEVRGVLLDTGGLPAKGFQVGLKTPDGSLFLSQPTAADGTFAIEGLPPATYQLAAFAPDGGEIPVVSKPVTLAAGQKDRVEIRLSSDKATVAGRVPEAGMVAPAAATSSTVGWANVGWAALAIAGTWGLGSWLLDDDDNDVRRDDSVSKSQPPRR